MESDSSEDAVQKGLWHLKHVYWVGVKDTCFFSFLHVTSLPVLLMKKTKNGQEKFTGEKSLLGPMLQHQGAAEEGVSRLSHKSA
jgi:hypothetical protein